MNKKIKLMAFAILVITLFPMQTKAWDWWTNLASSGTTPDNDCGNDIGSWCTTLTSNPFADTNWIQGIRLTLVDNNGNRIPKRTVAGVNGSTYYESIDMFNSTEEYSTITKSSFKAFTMGKKYSKNELIGRTISATHFDNPNNSTTNFGASIDSFNDFIGLGTNSAIQSYFKTKFSSKESGLSFMKEKFKFDDQLYSAEEIKNISILVEPVIYYTFRIALKNDASFWAYLAGDTTQYKSIRFYGSATEVYIMYKAFINDLASKIGRTIPVDTTRFWRSGIPMSIYTEPFKNPVTGVVENRHSGLLAVSSEPVTGDFITNKGYGAGHYWPYDVICPAGECGNIPDPDPDPVIPEPKDCDIYKVCTASGSFISDTDDWSCLFDTATTNNRIKKYEGNYCQIACQERVSISYPMEGVTVNAGYHFTVGGTGYVSNWGPITLSGVRTCQTTAPVGGDLTDGDIDYDQFAIDYAAANLKVQEAWDDYQVERNRAYVKSDAITNLDKSFSNSCHWYYTVKNTSRTNEGWMDSVPSDDPRTGRETTSVDYSYTQTRTVYSERSGSASSDNYTYDCNCTYKYDADLLKYVRTCDECTYCSVDRDYGTWSSYSTSSCSDDTDTACGSTVSLNTCRSKTQYYVVRDDITWNEIADGWDTHPKTVYYNGPTLTSSEKSITLSSWCSYYSGPTTYVSQRYADYNTAVAARTTIVNNLRRCNMFMDPYNSLDPKASVTYAEPKYGGTFPLEYTSTIRNQREYYIDSSSTPALNTYKRTSSIFSYDCGTSSRSINDTCRPSSLAYPSNDRYVLTTTNEFDFKLADTTYRYVTKPQDVSQSTIPNNGDQYIDIGYPNLPVHPTTPTGDYDLNLYLSTLGVNHVFNAELPGCNRFNSECHVNSGIVIDAGLLLPVFRIIDLKQPFPGSDGSGRRAGDNWDSNDIYNVILKNRGVSDTDIYNSPPMYEVDLSPSDILSIRAYNRRTTGGYADFNLLCEVGTGEKCVSTFIHTQYKNLFISNTCGMQANKNWNSCGGDY